MTILSFEECALAIIIIFWMNSIIRKEYKNRTNRILFAIETAVLLSTFTSLGAGSMFTYEAEAETYNGLHYIFEYVYFFSHNLILPFYLLYVYSSADIWHIFVKDIKSRVIWHALLFSDILLEILNGWAINLFSINSEGEYVRGPWILWFYGVAIAYAVWTIVIIWKYRKLIYIGKRRIMFLLYGIIFLGMLIQFLNPHFKTENFAIALALMFYMVMVRREENQVDPVTGAIKYSEGISRVAKNLISRKPISIVYIKINNNQNLHLYLGHDGYNDFLRFITEQLNDYARKCGYYADTFYMENGLFAMVGETVDEQVVKTFTNRIKDYFAEDIQFRSFTLVAVARICVVYEPEDLSDFSSLLTLATTFNDTMPDDGEVHFYHDYKDNREFRIRNELDIVIKRALENHGLYMYYQPIYSVKKQKFVAAEAFIRLKDREYGYISPSVFIPHAEVSGSIHEIGNFILDSVLKYFAQLDEKNIHLDYIEINLSPTQCIESDLVEKISNLLEKYNLSPDRVSFELTEALTEVNPEAVSSNLKRLHEMGCRIALDDYGTGYSDMMRMTQLPIDQVKLDKSFADMIDDENMWIGIQETMNMLREMNKEILVEGVEDERIAKRLSWLEPDLIQGCDLMQGFYFCKPMPEDAFADYLLNHQRGDEGRI